METPVGDQFIPLTRPKINQSGNLGKNKYATKPKIQNNELDSEIKIIITFGGIADNIIETQSSTQRKQSNTTKIDFARDPQQQNQATMCTSHVFTYT